MKNLGPVSRKELHLIGIHSLADIQKLGWEEVCIRWAGRFPQRINLNAFTSIIGAELDCDWRNVPPALRRRAEALASRLKAAQRRV